MQSDDYIESGGNYVENTSSLSRVMEEQYQISQNAPQYSTLAAIISRNIDTVDRGIEAISEFAGIYSAAQLTERQYNAPKKTDKPFAKAKRVTEQNIYINPTEKASRDFQRQAAYLVVRTATEAGLKYGVRAGLGAAQNRALYKSYYDLYRFLDYYLQSNKNAPGYIKASWELNKIRCSFQIKEKDKNKIKDAAKRSRIQSDDMIDFDSLYSQSDEWREGIAFFLTALASQLHEDEEQMQRSLSDFYDILGYHGNLQQELMRVNAVNYDAISLQQSKMNQIASKMITHLITPVPSVDLKAIAARSQEIRAFDPYEAKRKRNQAMAMKAAKATKKIAFSALLQSNPELAFLAGVQALSQFNLNNGDVAGDCQSNLRRLFGDDRMAQAAVERAKVLTDSAKTFF